MAYDGCVCASVQVMRAQPSAAEAALLRGALQTMRVPKGSAQPGARADAAAGGAAASGDERDTV